MSTQVASGAQIMAAMIGGTVELEAEMWRSSELRAIENMLAIDSNAELSVQEMIWPVRQKNPGRGKNSEPGEALLALTAITGRRLSIRERNFAGLRPRSDVIR